MFDIANRTRNLLGNYRYVSYLMRAWSLQARLGIDHQRPERRFLADALKSYSLERPWRTLDLGCGHYPRNPFRAEHALGCDIRENLGAGVLSCNLAVDPIPQDDESLHFVTAYEFIEHVPRYSAGQGSPFPFVNLMSEVYRVLKPGGLFFAKTPAYPGEEAFQDPTHINYITNNTFPFYFCWHPHGGPWGRIYGFNGRFILVKQRCMASSLLVLLAKPFD